MTIAFSAQRTPKKMVHLVRFRSTSEPPPKALPPPPMPNAPERPASLPEWSSTRKIRITEIRTSTTLSTVAMGGSLEVVASGGPVIAAAGGRDRIVAPLARIELPEAVDSLQDR